jgi:hypothetical protein
MNSNAYRSGVVAAAIVVLTMMAMVSRAQSASPACTPTCGGFRWPKQERRHDDVLEIPPPEGVRELPDSLETLVKSGIMPARYLIDENNLPLRSRREADYLVVESTGVETWTHRWQGLDAHRWLNENAEAFR